MGVTTAADLLATADPPAPRCLELAYDALRAGGLACGSVLVDAAGTIVAEGRNHAYDPASGSDVVEGSPIAHTEINVLARVPTARHLGADTLWSSQERCAMCTAAAAFVGVGAIAFVPDDPWALATNQSRAQRAADDHDGPPITGPAYEPWRTIANALFILRPRPRAARTTARSSGARRWTRWPPTSPWSSSATGPSWPSTLAELLEPVWIRLQPPQR